MSREKQIEEVARILNPNSCFEGDITACRKMECCDICKATKLYNAGYRKQSEGEWEWINQAKGYLEPPYGDTCKCSLCEFEIDVSESNYNFCPNCGAKMKGGAE